MAYRLLRLVASFLLIRLSLQQLKDPLKDFCRRFGHQTTVVDRKLYIDGGLVNWNPIASNPLNYTNQALLYNDLDNTQGGMPKLHTGLSKNSTVSHVSGGILWADEVNKVFYLFGGEYESAPEDFSLWAYDIIFDQWNATFAPSTGIQRVAWGAGVAVNEIGVGFYLGGWINSRTMPGWTGPPFATSNLIRYDMISNTFTNNTGPDGAGRAEGVMVYLPASDGGLLIYFGGIMDPNRNGTIIGSPMNKIHIYDIASTKWYTQTASGDIPDMRRKFCAGATWADDFSSYNIYLYGGQGITNVTGFDDVYILSLPSFTWIKWFPTEPGPGNPHSISSCNVVNRSQMIIIGGYFAQHDRCDDPDRWGTHNLNLGANGPQKAQWDLFYPNITKYDVPAEIIAKIGGGKNGGATQVKPQTWDNRDLPIYFTRTATFDTRMPTRAIPAPTNNSTHHKSDRTAVIAGSAAGGGAALIIIIASVIFCLYRRKKRRPNLSESGNIGPHPQIRPSELPGDDSIPELHSHAQLIAEPKPLPSPRSYHTVPTYNRHTSITQPPHSPSGDTPTLQHAPLGSYVELSTSPVSHNSPFPTYSSTIQQSHESHSPASYSPATYQPPSPYIQQYQDIQLLSPISPEHTHPGHMSFPPLPSPYNPSQHSLHQQHFPPPPSPRSGHSNSHRPGHSQSPSAYSDETYPPSNTTTPAHFYPQPLNVPRQPSGSSRASGGATLEEREKEIRRPIPVRGRFVEVTDD